MALAPFRFTPFSLGSVLAALLTSWQSTSLAIDPPATATQHNDPTAASGDYVPQFDLKETEDGVTVLLDGHLFTRYIKLSRSKPILWPILGFDGRPLTRQFPMQEAAAHEKADHPHHRSLWFTHGDVNGISFWEEPSANPDARQPGTIQHRRFARLAPGSTAVLVADNDWVDPQGHVVCSDVRTLTFLADRETRTIDFDITLRAGQQPAKFGDTKEGCFGVRVAGTMKVEEGLGGEIVNREGLLNEQAWGKRSAWVDYHGPAYEGGPTVGITLMNHPHSFRFPTYWHVRTYGLFAANPFGVHNFENSQDLDGSYELAPGIDMTLHYRMLIHRGNAEEAQIEQRYQAYARAPR